MSSSKVDSPKRQEQKKPAAAEEPKKLDVNTLEEDDEFEEFPVEDWATKELGEDEADDVNVWEDNWDDDAVEDDFSKQLRAELEKQGMKPGANTEKPR